MSKGKLIFELCYLAGSVAVGAVCGVVAAKTTKKVLTKSTEDELDYVEDLLEDEIEPSI